MPQARDRISRLCRESSVCCVCHAPFDLFRWSFGRERLTRKSPGQTLPLEQKGGAVQKRSFFLGGNVVAVSQLAGSASNVCGQCKV